MVDYTLLLTGSSGYLGQHLLWYWMSNGIGEARNDAKADNEESAKNNISTTPSSVTVVAVYHQHPSFSQSVEDVMLRQASSPFGATSNRIKVIPFSCDLSQPAAVDLLLNEYPAIDVCVHTAALSSPRVCVQDPDAAKRINVPEYFFQKLAESGHCRRLIALSTDQVYDGRKDTAVQGLYQETLDCPKPLNVYGQTKLDMELYLEQQQLYYDTILLRSSIILGPRAPLTKAHDTFLHFCASRNQQETTFFTNEYRTVVSVTHVCRVIDYFVSQPPPSSKQNIDNNTPQPQVFHLGGPFRVNRLDMAKAVFDYFQYDSHVLLPALQISTAVPLDISMDSTLLERTTGIIHEPKTLQGMVDLTLKDDDK